MREEVFQINVRKVVAQKAPRYAPWIPGFVFRALERLICQKEMNEVLLKCGNLEGLPFVKTALDCLGIRVRPHHIEDLPAEGRFIFVSNHPLGGLDGMVLIRQMAERYGQVRFVVNDLLMHVKPMAPLFVPVNKFGQQSQDYARRMAEAYGGSDQILYFPAGLCSRRIQGRIADLEWKKNVVQKAIQYDRAIVPLYFGGRNSNRFYRLANWRKRLGIKFNIEMLLLPQEMMRQKNATFDVWFGAPVPASALRGASPVQSIQKLREIVYSLPTQTPLTWK